MTESAREAKARPELSIFALGQARVERGERAITPSDWTYAKSRELLYYLLSHPPHTRKQIGLALWPEVSSSQLRRIFHVTLHHLRRALGDPKWIVFDNGHYAFDRSLSYWFDVEAFESKLAEAWRVQVEVPDLTISHLTEAIELYGGDFLEDSVDGEWYLRRREELRRKYQEAMLDLGGMLLTEGRHAEVTELYRKVIAHDRLLETAHRGLICCYAALGERGRALKHYRSLVELLHDELDSSPAPETTALYERLRSGEDV